MNELVNTVIRMVTIKKWQMKRNKVKMSFPSRLYVGQTSQAAGVNPMSI